MCSLLAVGSRFLALCFFLFGGMDGLHCSMCTVRAETASAVLCVQSYTLNLNGRALNLVLTWYKDSSELAALLRDTTCLSLQHKLMKSVVGI